MILSMSEQAWLFLLTVLTGMCVGLLYDLFRILRKVVRHHPFVVNIEDLVFWILATGIGAYFFLNENNGEVRIFAVLGIILGAVLYFAVLSRYIVTFGVWIVNLIKSFLKMLYKLTILPFARLLKWLWRVLPIHFLYKLLLQNSKRYAKIVSSRIRRDVSVIRKKT